MANEQESWLAYLISNWLPMLPGDGPPLPSILGIYWPWNLWTCPICHFSTQKWLCPTHLYEEHFLKGDITHDEYLQYEEKCPRR